MGVSLVWPYLEQEMTAARELEAVSGFLLCEQLAYVTAVKAAVAGVLAQTASYKQLTRSSVDQAPAGAVPRFTLTTAARDWCSSSSESESTIVSSFRLRGARTINRGSSVVRGNSVPAVRTRPFSLNQVQQLPLAYLRWRHELVRTTHREDQQLRPRLCKPVETGVAVPLSHGSAPSTHVSMHATTPSQQRASGMKGHSMHSHVSHFTLLQDDCLFADGALQRVTSFAARHDRH